MDCCNPYVRAIYIYIHTWVEFHPLQIQQRFRSTGHLGFKPRLPLETMTSAVLKLLLRRLEPTTEHKAATKDCHSSAIKQSRHVWSTNVAGWLENLPF